MLESVVVYKHLISMVAGHGSSEAMDSVSDSDCEPPVNCISMSQEFWLNLVESGGKERLEVNRASG